MVHFHESAKEFCYPWDLIARAIWLRYPNPWSQHVLSEDILERYITADGMLFTKRLLQKTNRMPKWGARFIKARAVYMVEESLVDAKSKTATTYTYNIGYQKVMSVHEKVVYHALSDASTAIARSCCVASLMFGVSSGLERFGIERYRRNISVAESGLLWTLMNHLEPQELLPAEVFSDHQAKLVVPINLDDDDDDSIPLPTKGDPASDAEMLGSLLGINPGYHPLFVNRVREYAVDRARELMQRAADMAHRFREQNARFNMYAKERAKGVMSRTADRRAALCEEATSISADDRRR